MVPLHANSFLNAFKIFFWSYSVAMEQEERQGLQSVEMKSARLGESWLSLTLGEALKRRQRLAAVALLNTDVNVVLSRLLLWLLLSLGGGLLIGTVLLFARVREGV